MSTQVTGKEIANIQGVSIFDIDIADYGVHVVYFYLNDTLYSKPIVDYSEEKLQIAFDRISTTIKHERRIKELQDKGLSRYEALLADSKERTCWSGKAWVACS